MRYLIFVIFLFAFVSCSRKDGQQNSNKSEFESFENNDHNERIALDNIKLLDESKVHALIESQLLDGVFTGSITNIYPIDTGFLFTASILEERGNVQRCSYEIGKLGTNFSLIAKTRTKYCRPLSTTFDGERLFLFDNSEEESYVTAFNSDADSLFHKSFKNIYNEGTNCIISLNDKYVLLNTDSYKLKIMSMDKDSLLFDKDFIADNSMQTFESVIKNRLNIGFISSVIKNSMGYPTIYTLDDELQVKTKSTLATDTFFHTNDSRQLSDSIIILLGSKAERRKGSFYKRPSLIITSITGEVYKRLTIPNSNPDISGEFISIVPFRSNYLLLIQDGIDFQGRLLLAEFNGKSLTLDWTYELYKTTGRHFNSLIVDGDKIIVYGGEYEKEAGIPQYDHPKLKVFTIDD